MHADTIKLNRQTDRRTDGRMATNLDVVGPADLLVAEGAGQLGRPLEPGAGRRDVALQFLLLGHAVVVGLLEPRDLRLHLGQLGLLLPQQPHHLLQLDLR